MHKCWECLESALAEENTKCVPAPHRRNFQKLEATTTITINFD